MYLKKLSLINFKNLSQESLTLDRGINCFVGANGTCKTNIVDAIYYLSMCKSALSMSDSQCVRFGENFFVVDGEYENARGRREQISCSFTKGGQKIMKRNGKPYKRLSEHVGVVPVVIVSPADSVLVSDVAEERRRYINAFLSQLDSDYLAAMIRYNQALAERNKYLKMGSAEEMLLIYDAQLESAAKKIHSARAAMVEQLQPVVAEYYRLISGDREQVELSYRSDLNGGSLSELLLASRQRDIINGFTSCGVHRDDLLFTIGGVPLRKYGSQGQQKSFIVALKLAQYHIIAEQLGEVPILLLDDVFDRLDEERVAKLVNVVSADNFGQIVITDCSRERVERLMKECAGGYRVFDVTYGKVLQ